MYELIISEKPQAAKKIADALDNGKPVKEAKNGVPYYKVTHGKKDIIVGCAVGHLYGLAEKEKTKGFSYPVFEIEWKPSADVRKGSAFSKKYLTVLKKLAKDADEFTVATDYDIEGEVIGLNCVKYACKQKDAARMKFSTLTKPDLIKSYENKSKTLNWPQAKAGETRHMMDWYYGINLSRALSSSIKKAGMFKILSAGRVQGPALKIVVDRENEIKEFKPVPFWQIELIGNAKGQGIIAWHKEDKFWEKEKADSVFAKVKKEKNGSVEKVERKQFKQAPPTPFDLTTMQIEAYRVHRIPPKQTLSIAQDLYTSGFISYPRTSSQQYPVEIGYDKIMNELVKQEKYKELAGSLAGKSLKPNNGKKTDPAHPAIYPTGIQPTGTDAYKLKIYDLIVRRFMATFAESAVRETMTVDINVKNELFIAKGTRTIEKGWHVYYGPYVKLEEEELPSVVKGDEVDIDKFKLHSKETQPPKRYTEASIIKALEKRGLGTKATRAQIVDTLFQRNYIHGKPIEATELGIKISGILEKYCPRIVDDKLTRHFENQMEDILSDKKKEEDVLKEARKVLMGILDDYKSKEDKLGGELAKTFKDTRTAMTTLGKCPNCKDGMLGIRMGRFGRFVACDKYPDCKTTLSLPANATFQVIDKVCEHCKHPMVKVIKAKKAPQELCINKDCSSKKADEKELENGIQGTTCTKCKKGKMVLRKSIYGQFYGCDKYPKCRNTIKIDNGDKKEVKGKSKKK